LSQLRAVQQFIEMMMTIAFAASMVFLVGNVVLVTAFSPPANRVAQHPLTRAVNNICYTPIATCANRYGASSSSLFVFPVFNWFQRKEQTPEGIEIPKEFTSRRGEADEEELLHRTVKMMENHRRSQEAAERTATIMEELSNSLVTGKSKAGTGTMGFGGSGVKVTFDGACRPISAEVDPKFLFSSTESGIISVEDLNAAITEAILDGYQQSGKLMEEKMKLLYEQLGLPREGNSK